MRLVVDTRPTRLISDVRDMYVMFSDVQPNIICVGSRDSLVTVALCGSLRPTRGDPLQRRIRNDLVSPFPLEDAKSFEIPLPRCQRSVDQSGIQRTAACMEHTHTSRIRGSAEQVSGIPNEPIPRSEVVERLTKGFVSMHPNRPRTIGGRVESSGGREAQQGLHVVSQLDAVRALHCLTDCLPACLPA
eukprot:1137429-Pyramimonas_sp.AAC.1